MAIELWDGHALLKRLARPASSGIARFFFDASILTHETIQERLAQQVVRTGTRYQPLVHVANEELESLFEWMSYHEQLREAVTLRMRELLRLLDLPAITSHFGTEAEFVKERQLCMEEASILLRALGSAGGPEISPLLTKVLDPARQIEYRFFDLESRTSRLRGAASEADKRVEAAWSRMRDAVIVFRRELGWLSGASRHLPYVDRRAVLLTGEGGCGKTHLLCKIAEQASAAGRPVILALGHRIVVRTLWNDVISLVGTPLGDHVECIRALNAAGQRCGCRALLVIDALNEAVGNGRWPEELRALQEALRPYPHIALICSVRDSYLRFVLPAEENWQPPQVQHSGFRDHIETAIVRYCDYYNIVLPDLPLLQPDFGNPLFLNVFCRAIAGKPDPQHERSPTAFPTHIGSFSELMDRYVSELEERLHALYGLDRDRSSRPLKDALRAIAAEIGDNANLEVPQPRCAQILGQHLQFERLSGNLVGLLEQEGLLLRVGRHDAKGHLEESVQFGYDRLGADLVVASWLEGCKGAKGAWQQLMKRAAFKDILAGRVDYYRGPSVVEALHLRWMEQFDATLFDCRAALFGKQRWCDLFLAALARAPVQRINKATVDWALRALELEPSDRRASVTVSLLSRVAVHQLTEGIHMWLSRQALAERDAWWTTYISGSNRDYAVQALVAWPLDRSAVRAPAADCANYSTSLAWLTASTDKLLRASATKAMAAVLEHQLDACIPLLQRFRRINDPYVLESVAMAVYGACMRSRDAEATTRVAQAVMSLWGSKAKWPVALITRHALSGIVEIASERDPSLDVNLASVRPPYGSRWIGRLPTWGAIKRREQQLSKQKRYALWSIVSSCRPEYDQRGHPGGYGDFGRYVVDSVCHVFFSEQESIAPFPRDAPHRFIIQRVQDLGWQSELFEEFDRSVSNSRHRNKVERIGKKYQWIALSEFLARAVDKFPLPAQYGTKGPDRYHSAWQLRSDNMTDTSLLRIPTRDDRNAAEDAESWWFSVGDAYDWSQNHDEWLLNNQGFPDPRRVLIQAAPGASSRWAVLSAFASWLRGDPASRPEDKASPQRKIWMQIRACVIRKIDRVKVEKWVHAHRDWDHYDMPEEWTLTEAMFGELYWSRGSKRMIGELRTQPWTPMPRELGYVPAP